MCAEFKLSAVMVHQILMRPFLLALADMEPLSLPSLVPNTIKENEVMVVRPIGDPPKRNKYVDPRTYPSLTDAMNDVGIQEIPSEELSKLDEIGCGEPCFDNYFLQKLKQKN